MEVTVRNVRNDSTPNKSFQTVPTEYSNILACRWRLFFYVIFHLCVNSTNFIFAEAFEAQAKSRKTCTKKSKFIFYSLKFMAEKGWLS